MENENLCLPELPLEDVEKILFLSENSIQEAQPNDIEQQETQNGSFPSLSLCYSSEVLNSDNMCASNTQTRNTPSNNTFYINTYTDSTVTNNTNTNNTLNVDSYTDDIFSDNLYINKIFTQNMFANDTYTDDMYSYDTYNDTNYTGIMYGDNPYSDIAYQYSDNEIRDNTYSNNTYSDNIHSDNIYSDNISCDNSNRNPPVHLKYGVLNINMKRKGITTIGVDTKDTNDYMRFSTVSKVIPIQVEDEEVLTKPKFSTVQKSVERESEERLKCKVCTKPALEFSSYGGFVCSSCRSFFRRSVMKKNYPICRKGKVCNIDPGTRINCRYCRFQLCIRSGMKVSWVLSEQEKDRRFKKCKQENIPQLLSIPFSALEENIIDDLKIKVYGPWSKLFCMLDEEASALLMEFVYRQDNSRTMSLEIIKKTCLDYPRNVLPTLKELDDLSPHDVGQIMNSTNSGIAPFFLVSYSIHIGLSAQVHNSPEFLKMKALARNQKLITRLELLDSMSSGILSLPDRWKMDKEAEVQYREHRKAIHERSHWSANEDIEVGYVMIGLMTFIIAFNDDFYYLENRDRVEKIQLKFILILQRYLRSRLPPEAANTKFLESMMLISQYKEKYENTFVSKTSNF